MNFNTWLKAQKNRDDIVGDLAVDFIRTGFTCLKESFRRHIPCEGAVEAYEQAKREYKEAKASKSPDQYSICA